MNELIGSAVIAIVVFLVYKGFKGTEEAREKGIKEGARRCAQIASSHIQDKAAKQLFENEVRNTFGI